MTVNTESYSCICSQAAEPGSSRSGASRTGELCHGRGVACFTPLSMASVHPARAALDTASGTAIFSGHGDSATGVAGDAIVGSGTSGTTNAQAARKTIGKPPSVEQFPTDADEGAESIPVQRSDAGQDDAARISLHAADTQGGNLPAATRLWGLLYTCQAALGVAVTLALCLEWCNSPADTLTRIMAVSCGGGEEPCRGWPPRKLRWLPGAGECC